VAITTNANPIENAIPAPIQNPTNATVSDPNMIIPYPPIPNGLTVPTGIQLAPPPLPDENDIDMTYGIPNEGIMMNAGGRKIPVGLPGIPPSMPSIPEGNPEDDMDREVDEIPDSIEQEENKEDIAVIGENGCVCDPSGVMKCVPFHIAKGVGMIIDKNPGCKADRECTRSEVPVCINKNWINERGDIQEIILQNDGKAEEEEDMYGDTKYDDGIDDDIEEVEDEADDIDDDIEEEEAVCDECEEGYTAGCYTKEEISKYQLQETGNNICKPERGECGLNEVVVCVENEKYDRIENEIEEEEQLKDDELIDETINRTGGITSFENVTEYLRPPVVEQRQPVIVPPPSGPSGVQIIPPVGFEPGVYYPIRIRKKEDDSYLYGPDPKKPRQFEGYGGRVNIDAVRFI